MGSNLLLGRTGIAVKHRSEMLRPSFQHTIDTTDLTFIRANSLTQRLNPDTTASHLGDLVGKVHGTGIYDGTSVTLKKVEKANGFGGPYTEVTPRTNDPSHVFPSVAANAGAPFNLVMDPDEFVWNTLWFKVTVTFDGVGDKVIIGGVFSWDKDIYPVAPASVAVPVTSSSGNFQVTWPEVDGATYYKIQEGIEDSEGGITWGGITNTGSDNWYDAIGKAVDTTFWYRVLAGNTISNESAWIAGANGCLVERPAFRITPDMGWANIDAMFDAALNKKLTVFNIDELSTTAENPQYVKNRNSLIFMYDGTNYIIPGDQIDKFGGNGLHYWRYLSDPISTFILSRSPLQIESTKKIRAPDSTQPRIIG